MNKKENAISKINTMGKVGTILALITKILLIIAMVLLVVSTVVLAVLPDNLFRVNMRGNANVIFNMSGFGENILKDADVEEIQEEITKNQKITYAGNQFAVSEVEVDTQKDEIVIDAEGELTNFTSHQLVWALLGALLQIALTLMTVIFISRLTKAIRDCKSPFETRVIVRMKQFAYSLIPWAVASWIINAMESRIWMSGGGIHFELNVNVIIVVLVILALAYIFQYGAVLQQESDETL